MMKHVFISYVQEDSSMVDFIKSYLEMYGVEVWIDRTSLAAGQRWKYAIRKSIEEGVFFIACFSENYNKRSSTYMNEELIIAIEQLRLKPFNKSWFIPIRLAECNIPDRPIGAGENLCDIQRIDLFNDLIGGLEKLAEIIVPVVSPYEYLNYNFRRLISYHIHKKIEHYKKLGSIRFKQIEDKWLELLEKNRLNIIFNTFFELYDRLKSTGQPQLDRIIEPQEDGKVILKPVQRYRKKKAF